MTAPSRWPMALKRKDAAAYCSLTMPEFEREIAAANLPLPVKLGNHEHWSRARLDEALDRLTGQNEDWKRRLYNAA